MPRARIVWIMLPLTLSGLSCSGEGRRPARVRIGRNVWQVEIADNDATRRRGLAGRDEVGEGTGMLFAFPRQEVLQFHMLNCRVPLDVAFISSRLRIVEIREMVVEADPAHPTCGYSSKHPARYALEVPGGSFRRLGVRAGDRVELLGAALDAAKGAR